MQSVLRWRSVINVLSKILTIPGQRFLNDKIDPSEPQPDGADIRLRGSGAVCGDIVVIRGPHQ